MPRRGPVAIYANHVSIPEGERAALLRCLKSEVGRVVKSEIPIVPKKTSGDCVIEHVAAYAVREPGATEAYASCEAGKVFASPTYTNDPTRTLYVTWVVLYSSNWTARPLSVVATILETTRVRRSPEGLVDRAKDATVDRCVLRMGMRMRRDDASVHIAMCDEMQFATYMPAAPSQAYGVTYHRAAAPPLTITSAFAAPMELAMPLSKRSVSAGVDTPAIACVYPLAHVLRSWTAEMHTARLSDVLPSLMDFHRTSLELLDMIQGADATATMSALTWKHVGVLCLVYMPIWLWHGQDIKSQTTRHACATDSVFIEALCARVHPPFPARVGAFPAWLVRSRVNNVTVVGNKTSAFIPWDAMPVQDARRVLRDVYVNEWRTWLCAVAVPFWTRKLVDHIADRITDLAIVEGLQQEADVDANSNWRKSVVLLSQLRDLCRLIAAPHFSDPLLREILLRNDDDDDDHDGSRAHPVIAPVLQCHAPPDCPLSPESLEALAKLRNFYLGLQTTQLLPARHATRLSISGAAHELLRSLMRHVSDADAALLAEPDYLDANDLALAPPCMQHMHNRSWRAGLVPKFEGKHTWTAALATLYKTKALLQKRAALDEGAASAASASIDMIVPLMRTIAWLVHYTETATVSTAELGTDMSHRIDDLIHGIVKYCDRLTTPRYTGGASSSSNRYVNSAGTVRLDALLDGPNSRHCETTRCGSAIQHARTANGNMNALDAREFYCPVAVDMTAGIQDMEDAAVFEMKVLRQCHARVAQATAAVVADADVKIHFRRPRRDSPTPEFIARSLEASLTKRGGRHPANLWAAAYAASLNCNV